MATRDSQKRASIKYAKEHLKRVPLDMQLKDYEQVKAHAGTMGESVNGFIKRAIRETLERDRGSGSTTEEG